MTTISVVLVTGGWRGDSSGLVSVELVHTNGSRICSLTNLPFKRVYHSQTGVTLCGSYDARSTCLTLSSSGSWEESHNLAKHRYWHTAWESPQGTILLGGEAPIGSTTEILTESGDTTPGFCLPYQTE